MQGKDVYQGRYRNGGGDAMRHRGFWIALMLASIVLTSTSCIPGPSAIIQVPSGEDRRDPRGKRYYSIPVDGGTHMLEIGGVIPVCPEEWQALLELLFGKRELEIARVEFRVFNPRTGEVREAFDGGLWQFLSLGTMEPGDYEGKKAFKFHLPVEFPTGVECWYAKAVLWIGNERAAHADMRIYAGGYDRFVDTYGMWY